MTEWPHAGGSPPRIAFLYAMPCGVLQFAVFCSTGRLVPLCQPPLRRLAPPCQPLAQLHYLLAMLASACPSHAACGPAACPWLASSTSCRAVFTASPSPAEHINIAGKKAPPASFPVASLAQCAGIRDSGKPYGERLALEDLAQTFGGSCGAPWSAPCCICIVLKLLDWSWNGLTRWPCSLTLKLPPSLAQRCDPGSSRLPCLPQLPCPCRLSGMPTTCSSSTRASGPSGVLCRASAAPTMSAGWALMAASAPRPSPTALDLAATLAAG